MQSGDRMSKERKGDKMNIPRRTMAFLLSAALALSLASCGQGEVNEERLPSGGQGGQESSDSTQGPTGGEDEPPYDWDPDDPAGFNNSVEVEDSTFEDTRRALGLGTVLFTVTSAGLYDSLEDAGISEESYAASGEETCDHYIKVDITVKNVDVSDAGEDYNVNNFKLMGHVYFRYVDPVWFSLGGQADDEERAYFHFYLPPAGETKEISVAFGLSDSELAAFRESDGIWLTYNIPTLQRLKLEGLL